MWLDVTQRQLWARITSGRIILDKSRKNKIFSEILEEYNGVCLKNFQQMQQKLENAFLANFSIFFFENFVTLKN